MRKIKKPSEKKELDVNMEPEIEIDEENVMRNNKRHSASMDEKDPLEIQQDTDGGGDVEEDDGAPPAKKKRGRQSSGGAAAKAKKAASKSPSGRGKSKRGKSVSAKASVVKEKRARKSTVIAEDDSEIEYEVADIVTHKTVGKKTMYKIRWKGYGPKDDTWEEESTLNCDDIMAKYRKRDGPIKRPKTKAAKKVMPSPTKPARGAKKGKSSAKVKNGAGPKPSKRGRKPKAALEEAEWEVEDIVDHRINKHGELELCIKWKGYSSEENTWEPESNVGNSDKLLQKFKKSNNLD